MPFAGSQGHDSELDSTDALEIELLGSEASNSCAPGVRGAVSRPFASSQCHDSKPSAQKRSNTLHFGSLDAPELRGAVLRPSACSQGDDCKPVSTEAFKK